MRASAAVSRETHPAAMKAAWNPAAVAAAADPASPLPADARAAVELKTAMPKAPPIWNDALAIPEASPACSAGTAEVMIMVEGMKLSAMPAADSKSPGSTSAA